MPSSLWEGYVRVSFVHLHCHSDFSLLDGASSVEALVAKAKELGMPALALTDHGNMFGILKFYKECKKQGIKPIVGCEFYVAPGSRTEKSGSEKSARYYHLVLLAKNQDGYKNLMLLSSMGYTEGFYYKPRIDDEVLATHANGLIALSACLAGEIPSAIMDGRSDEARKKALHYRDVFGPGNFYLELQDHGIAEQKTVNDWLVSFSAESGIPLVATNDIHYTERDDARAQDILICIGTNKKVSEGKRLKFEHPEFYFKSAEEMQRLFERVPQALANTCAIAEACLVDIQPLKPQFPVYEVPAGQTPEAYLTDLARRGLAERFNPVPPDAAKRLEYELSVITSMGFTGYFLIVWDFIHFAKQNGIAVGPGRGSGAGSLVAYSLKITDIDPLRYGLLFERFLNPERVSMPDFDIDFCHRRREEVITYVTRKYGSEKVGQIITFGTLKARAVIRDVARVLDFPYEEADAIAKLIPEGPKSDLSQAVKEEPKAQARAAIKAGSPTAAKKAIKVASGQAARASMAPASPAMAKSAAKTAIKISPAKASSQPAAKPAAGKSSRIVIKPSASTSARPTAATAKPASKAPADSGGRIKIGPAGKAAEKPQGKPSQPGNGPKSGRVRLK